jgi:hypothetical protein
LAEDFDDDKPAVTSTNSKISKHEPTEQEKAELIEEEI